MKGLGGKLLECVGLAQQLLGIVLLVFLYLRRTKAGDSKSSSDGCS